MLAWAEKKLFNLAETMAPPASSPAHRYLSACASNDEQLALACLAGTADPTQPPLDPRGLVHPSKGTQPIHVACQYGLINLAKTLLTTHGVPVDAFDYKGNTPMHFAAQHSESSPTHLTLIKLLISDFKSSAVTVKNADGQTPYDVATGMNVRNYLLPLQLQKETQTCLDNGGQGLMPGIDLGGCRVNHGAAGAGPPTAGGPPYSHPPPPANNAPPPPSSGPHSYERCHTSSSAPNSAGAKIIPNDGFHSSSSDVNLQRKYNHANVQDYSHVPPPPTGMSSSAPNTGGAPITQQQNANGGGMPAPPFSYGGYYNSAAAGGGAPKAKYLAYDAVTGTASLPPSGSNSRTGTPQPPAATYQAPPAYQVFQPSGVNTHANGGASPAAPAAAPSPTMPNQAQALSPSPTHASSPVPPMGAVPQQQQQPFTPAPVQPVTTSMPPPQPHQQPPAMTTIPLHGASSTNTPPPHGAGMPPPPQQTAPAAANPPAVAAGGLGMPPPPMASSNLGMPPPPMSSMPPPPMAGGGMAMPPPPMAGSTMPPPPNAGAGGAGVESSFVS